MALIGRQWTHHVFEAVIEVILDKGFLGLLDCFLHGLQLLCNIQTFTTFNHHFDGAVQMPAGPAKPLDDGRMGGMCVWLFHCKQYPLGEVTISPLNSQPQQTSMTPIQPSSMRPSRPALGMRWLVLVVILFGTLISSVGSMNSHGLAALVAGFHDAPSMESTSHEHERDHDHSHEVEDDELEMMGHVAPPDHPHHGADHSHDKAHALPAAWETTSPLLPVWIGVVRPWAELVQVSRLERPPMG